MSTLDVLIIADDLSGAADCAAAAGRGAIVALDWPPVPTAGVVAIDLDSRRLDPDAAQVRAGQAMREIRHDGPQLIYQKMDSVLRGNWAWELSAIRAALAGRSGAPLAVVAPAWPERGRIVLGGEVRVDRELLGSSGLTDDAGRPLDGRIAGKLGAANVASVWSAAGSPGEILQKLRDVLSTDIPAIVFDAATRADLDAIAAAALMLRESVFFVGSGGLMSSLAKAAGLRPAGDVATARTTGPVLIVVGSASAISRRQLAALERAGVAMVGLTAGQLEGAEAVALGQVERALLAQRSVAVAIEASEGGGLRPNLVAELARRLAPLLRHCGGMVLTGGETARAVLAAAGCHAIRIVGELEPGVPLGTTVGPIELPVVTKAGAFGSAQTLLDALRALEGRAADPDSKLRTRSLAP